MNSKRRECRERAGRIRRLLSWREEIWRQRTRASYMAIAFMAVVLSLCVTTLIPQGIGTTQAVGHTSRVRQIRCGVASVTPVSGRTGGKEFPSSGDIFAISQPRVRGKAYDHAQASCTAVMAWPVEPHQVMRHFEAPEQEWSAGHRGLDLEALPGTTLLAPDDGIVSFNGEVAGKSVVSLQSSAFTLTFEPAASELHVGASVRKRMPFAVVSGGSDHCQASCVHWGVRREERQYYDPERLVSNRKIVLKPAGDG